MLYLSTHCNAPPPHHHRALGRALGAGSDAGSVPPIYTKGAISAYLYGGGVVRAHRPWDTFPTERRRRGVGFGVGPTYLHKRGHFCIYLRRGFGAGAWTVGHVPYREAAAAGW